MSSEGPSNPAEALLLSIFGGSDSKVTFEEYHEFDEEEPLCLNCEQPHSDCGCEKFEVDPDTEDICTECGLGEADDFHQTEE